jgi:hypothetical protein
MFTQLGTCETAASGSLVLGSTDMLPSDCVAAACAVAADVPWHIAAVRNV